MDAALATIASPKPIPITRRYSAGAGRLRSRDFTVITQANGGARPHSDRQTGVFEPCDRAYTELPWLKVAGTQTYSSPVPSGKRLFIKDQDSVTLWTLP